MKLWITVVSVLIVAGCAGLHQQPLVPADARMFEEARVLSAQGKFALAHDAYRKVAGMPHSSFSEQALFSDVLIYVSHRNPDRDYAAAEVEFEKFVERFPLSPMTEEARSWAAVLKNFDQSKARELLNEIESQSISLEILTMELQDNQAHENKISKERDSLIAEEEKLTKKIADLLKEKDHLLSVTTTITAERDGLEQDKIALQKKVAALTGEKDALIKAKKKLEKSLHDLTMVDVKMEKKRKKIKKEETTKSMGSAPR